ncbi:MAG: PEGA domain-containing protein [Caldisericaceae bacterium]
MKKILAILLVVLLLLVSGCKPAAKEGSVTIDSVPEGASISIDGVSVGKTPLDNYKLSLGKHKVTLSMEGYDSKTIEFTVEIGKNTSLSFALAKLPEMYSVLIKTTGNFMIVLDKHWLGKLTGKPVSVEKGVHEIQLINYFETMKRPYSLIGTFDVNRDIVLSDSDFTRENPQISQDQLFFPVQFVSDVPVIRCCSAAAFTYCGIYVNQTAVIKGYVQKSTKAFYVIFPSEKKIEVKTVPGTCDDCANYFEKKITFDEPGKYVIEDKDNPDTILGEDFKVFYKAKPVSPITTVGDIFPNHKGDKGIVVIEGKDEKIDFLITDANGKVMRNTPIGAYDLKTDSNGIVSFTLNGKFDRDNIYGCCGEITVNRKFAPVLIYGDILASLVRERTISKRYATIINGELCFPEEMVAPCLYENPQVITQGGKNYINVDDILKYPDTYPDNAAVDNGDTITVYGLITMAP